ncbi:MAG TPA: peptide deformylase [Terriglobia bacterium]|nr:peptide deformylase [Terriglobia bacterium]
MSILKIAKLGHPVLRQVAQPVPSKEIASPEIQRLIRDMVETMREYEGVGLAATQVHQSVQILAVDALGDPKNPKETTTPLTVLINPVITVVSETLEEGWEGCLSIPNMRGLVPRHREIKVQAVDPSGRSIHIQAKDFFARVIQHEHDHLTGIVFLDRMRSLSSLTYLKEYSRFWQKLD